MNTLSSLADVNALHYQLTNAGEDWSDKDAAARALEDVSKSLLAEITLSFLSIATFKTTRAEAETRALANGMYRDHLASAIEARRLANRARVKYDGVKVYVELLRTAESTRRAEMRL